MLATLLPATAEPIGPPAPAVEQSVDTALRHALAGDDPQLATLVAAEQSALASFYASRAYAPLWTTPSGLAPIGNALITALLRIDGTGPDTIGPLIAATRSSRATRTDSDRAHLELVLSAALVRAAVDPTDLAATSGHARALQAVAVATDPHAVLREWLPPDPWFWRLRAAVVRYRAFEAAGGWPQVPTGPKLEMGMRGERVALLRTRLAYEGDGTEESTEPEVFDESLREAVHRFQGRHGLAVDGVVGRATIDALNTPARTRVKTLLLNLRRLHARAWASERRHVIVNVAGAAYRLIDEDRVVFAQVAIVGRRDWPTPMLDSIIDRMEINPYWHVPPRITRLELLPRLRRDPGYLARNNMRLVGGIYRQDPGPRNPLGVVKFLFPNRYSVYLHDTNHAELFLRPDRFLSHGCIRVSNARELAAYLLTDMPEWGDDRLQMAIASGRTRTIMLAQPMPIHLVYETAWVDPSGTVHFRRDTYGRDR